MSCSVMNCERPIRARGLCGTHYSTWYRANNPERARTVARYWYDKTGFRFVQHGITREWAEVIYELQRGRCAGCGRAFPFDALVIDHDHEHCAGHNSCGLCVRALLCHACNINDVLGRGLNYVVAESCFRCGDVVHARGLCNRHYKESRRVRMR